MANGSPTLYTPLNLTTDQYTDDVQLVTGLFSNGSGTLAGSSIFTASLSSSDQKYFVTIQDAAGSSGTEYIDISYGHAFGSGSDMSGGANNTAKATQAIYGQMAGAFLDDPREQFTFKTGSEAGATDDSIYVMSVKSSQMKDLIDYKHTIVLSGSNVSGDTANGVNLSLTAFSSSLNANAVAGKYSPVVSGAAGVPHDSSGGTVFGYFYENAGTWIFSHDALSGSIEGDINGISGSEAVLGAPTNFFDTPLYGLKEDTRTDGNANNPMKFKHCLHSGSLTIKNIQNLNQTTYYCRSFHNMHRHSSNPTFIQSGSATGDILEEFQKNRIVYVTSIGLFNDNTDLIAVAKLNKPQKKDAHNEITFAVKVNG